MRARAKCHPNIQRQAGVTIEVRKGAENRAHSLSCGRLERFEEGHLEVSTLFKNRCDSHSVELKLYVVDCFISSLFRMGIMAEYIMPVCNREYYAVIQRMGNLPGVLGEVLGVGKKS